MNLFTVNKDTCKRDGYCAFACPMGIIQLKEDSFPEPVTGADELCIRCGHCVSVCPHEAFSHSSMSPEQCTSIEKEMLLSPEQVENFIRMRRSIRNYKKKQVDRDSISKLIHVARYAPTGHNAQQVAWTVIYEPDMVQKIGEKVIEWMRFIMENHKDLAAQMHLDMVVKYFDIGVDTICRGAPHLVLAHTPGTAPSGPSDCIIALTSFELAAPSFGLGTCWAGFVMAALKNWQPLVEELNLPGGQSCHGAMMLGYPKFRYRRMPVRNEPVISWL